MSGAMQWTARGMVAAGTPIATSETPTPAVTTELFDDRDVDEPASSQAKRSPPVQKPEPQFVMTPRDVVKLARTRLRDVKREISRLRKLEVERDELQRLLDAAKGKSKGSRVAVSVNVGSTDDLPAKLTGAIRDIGKRATG